MRTVTRKMGVNKNYIVGILDDSSVIPNPTAAQKSKELTEFFTRFKYFGKILSGTTVNQILDKALEEDKIALPFPENDYHSPITKTGEKNDTRPNTKHTINN